jgi:hypothetical protein
MFTTTPITSPFAGRSHAQALEAWRAAADLVGVRWREFRAAGSESRSWAFAVYVAALDAEEAAAAELAALALTDVAA